MKPCLVDANVWLALAHTDHVHYREAVSWFETLSPRQALFCHMAHLALLRLLTTRAVMGPATLTIDAAWHVSDVFVADPRVAFAVEPPGISSAFRRFTRGTAMAPKVWADAYLAALAVESGFALVSFDRGFARYPGLTWVRPGA